MAKNKLDNAIEKVVAQDFSLLSNCVDVLSPRVYHVMCGKAVSWITEITNYVAKLSRKPVYPIIQAGSQHNRILSREEFQTAIEAGRAKKSSGIIIFSMDDLIREDKLDTMIEVFA